MESPVVTSDEMRAAEAAAFARGSTPETLMDEAAAGIARAITKFFPTPGHCLVFAGKGNNAGDGFAAARLLASAGWTMDLHLAFSEKACGPLARKKFRALRPKSGPKNHSPLIILDCLLGLGAKPPLREPITAACREINRLRNESNVFVFALDLPTGLDGDSGAADPDTVVADFTLTIGYAKRGLIADRA
ncbi:MAG: NAD(P)H-hydrate epimerase, partial [Chthoniobacterales bacterium]